MKIIIKYFSNQFFIELMVEFDCWRQEGILKNSFSWVGLAAKTVLFGIALEKNNFELVAEFESTLLPSFWCYLTLNNKSSR